MVASATARVYSNPEEGLREQSRETLAAIRGGLLPTPAAVADRFGLTREAASKRLAVLRDRGLIDGATNHTAPVEPIDGIRAHVEQARERIAALRAQAARIEESLADYEAVLAFWDERHPPQAEEEAAA